jgi:hypothetical protein
MIRRTMCVWLLAVAAAPAQTLGGRYRVGVVSESADITSSRRPTARW